MRISISRRRGPPLTPGKLMIVAPLIGLALVGLASVVFVMGTENQRYARDGMLVDAHVIGSHQRAGENTSFITVQVANPRLRPGSRDVQVDAETYTRFKPASDLYPMPTQVYHLPSHPKQWQHVNEFDDGDKNRIPIILSFTVMGLGMITLGFFAFTKWRRGETVMQKPVDDAVPPEVIEALQRIGIPTAHFPQQAIQTAPWEQPPGPPPAPNEHVLYDSSNPPQDKP